MPSSSQPASAQESLRFASPEVALSITTSPSKLIKYARNLELDRNAAHTEIQELRRKIADISNKGDYDSDEGTPPAKKSRQDTQKFDADSRAHEEQVMKAGHLYVMMYGLWLHLGERTFTTEYDQDAHDSERFENMDTKVQGQLREITGILGADLSQQISEPWLIKAFMNAMRTQRSNTANRLRHQCAMLFDVSEHDMLRAETRKEKFRERIGWVEVDGHGSYSSVDAEVLHKNYGGKLDKTTVFLNPILMRVFCAIIRGPMSAKEMINGTALNPKTDTMARKHQLRNITPGAIAATAVFTRWALSSDDSFQSVGHNTGINYSKDFDEYLEFLMSGLRRKKKTVLNIIREWDRVIFPNSESSLVHQDASTSSSFKTAMQMLDDDETEDNVADDSGSENNTEDLS